MAVFNYGVIMYSKLSTPYAVRRVRKLLRSKRANHGSFLVDANLDGVITVGVLREKTEEPLLSFIHDIARVIVDERELLFVSWDGVLR